MLAVQDEVIGNAVGLPGARSVAALGLRASRFVVVFAAAVAAMKMSSGG